MSSSPTSATSPTPPAGDGSTRSGFWTGLGVGFLCQLGASFAELVAPMLLSLFVFPVFTCFCFFLYPRWQTFGLGMAASAPLAILIVAGQCFLKLPNG